MGGVLHPEYGTVSEVREVGGVSTYFLDVDGQPWHVDALQDQFDE